MVTIEGSYVRFSFVSPTASDVSIAGDFNDWQTGQFGMTRQADGTWIARMRLPAGEFKFRYCADGQWYTDYAAFGVEPGRFGLDSVLRVPAPKLAIRPITAQTAAA